ncbi:CAAX amino terminal protease family protein [Rhynchospora pubera]|uniref:CAAX amino terminal protease family protein n=1 Tax=Rhynchospora pubera TaxID=906938 RepID=A0AAV8EG79_9POAL|nr:CAAX amino terminal protease family protein [Rhynchospora pubera]
MMPSLCETLFSFSLHKQLLGVPILSKNGKNPISWQCFLTCPNSKFSLSSSPAIHVGFSFARSCTKKSHADQLFDGFDDICTDIPWEANDVWSTFVGYLFMLHIPLSFGGLPVVSSVLHKPTLDPLTMVVATAVFQSLELFGTFALLQYATKINHDFYSFLIGKVLLPKRNWVTKTAVGIGFLITLVSVTSILADMLIGPEDANDPIIKEILSEGPAAQIVLFFLYCINAPLIEETVYRGFLLTSLMKKSKPWSAIIEEQWDRVMEREN